MKAVQLTRVAAYPPPIIFVVIVHESYREMFRLLCCIALAGLLGSCIASVEPLSDDPDLVGVVQWVEVDDDGRFDVLVESESAGTHGITSMRFKGSKKAPVFLLSEGRMSAISAGSIEVGDKVQGWFGNVIMDSLPPQTQVRRLMVIR
jgi:hypothetical protein